MKLHENLSDLPKLNKTVLTVGTFDGVHAGHRKIINKIISISNDISAESVIISFYPHPRLLINPSDESLHLINSKSEKAEILEKMGVDHLVIVPFSREFSNQTAEEYIKYFLVKNFNPAVIVIGYDHRFGKNREGNVNLLKTFSTQFGYKVIEISKETVDNLAVSSTLIRKNLIEGSLNLANKLLKYPFFITGTVVKGDQRGRTIGFPTANILPEEPFKLVPALGVYAVYVKYGSVILKGVMNIGNRPTVDGKKVSFEVYIFDFNKEIYGERITVYLIDFIRQENKFNSLNDLKVAIKIDSEKALETLEKIKFNHYE